MMLGLNQYTEVLSNYFEILSKYFEILSHYSEILSHYFALSVQGNRQSDRTREIVQYK